MAAAAYRFVTRWQVGAPLEAVWDVIYDMAAWPAWWRGVRSVTKVTDGEGDGVVGSVYRIAWQSVLPYTLTFDVRTTRVERERALEGEANGNLAGTGRWAFSQSHAGTGPVTTVEYYWDVTTTEAWMNWLSVIARPLFAWNHDVVMRWGGEGLARRLGATLLAAESWENAAGRARA